ncbi:hypothetical protein E7T09_04445 [Deinococcus sp. KSM4-11]|uniref:hypothetical protein n=1 Tax=Deinococcus sp. KSM4-11 TaxID=2568654 RepID=UPI0010A49C7C|nr:hypothetical protein [Deinococcus sp. KSM4-11]THF88460.1 hypothetical protein E7T09_04445 [Deinococcus sp. KSM4-11]
MRQVVVTKRTAHTRRPERVQALGPQTMAQPLDGSYQALHSVEWSLYWHRARGLILEQRQGAAWVEVLPGQAFPPMSATTRHIGLAFDQAARHVVCWEDQGQIVARQWDPNALAYTYRGPFAGVDPLLFTDTMASYFTPGSDVVLMYLNGARTAAFYRLQRDAYGVEYPLVVGLTDAVLDQVVALSYGAQVRGETGGNDLVIDLGLYPIRGRDRLSGVASLGGISEVIAVLATARNALNTTASLSGLYLAGQLAFTPKNVLTGAAVLLGAFENLTVPYVNRNALAGTGSLTGSNPVVVVPVTNRNGVAGQGSITGGTYAP